MTIADGKHLRMDYEMRRKIIAIFEERPDIFTSLERAILNDRFDAIKTGKTVAVTLKQINVLEDILSKFESYTRCKDLKPL